MMFKRSIVATAVALLAALPAAAQVGPDGPSGQPAAKLLNKMHMANTMMIRLGELAQDKAHNEEVRAFAERAVKDHTFGDGKVQDLAGELGVELQEPMPMSAMKKQMKQENQPMHGSRQAHGGDAGDGAEGSGQSAQARTTDREESTSGAAADRSRGEETSKQAKKEHPKKAGEHQAAHSGEKPGDEARHGSQRGEAQAKKGMAHSGRRMAGESQPRAMKKMQKMAMKLQQAPPEEFDGMYMKAMAKMHDTMIGDLSKAQEQLAQEELRDLLEDLIPILDQHRQLAKAVQSDLETGVRRASR